MLDACAELIAALISFHSLSLTSLLVSCFAAAANVSVCFGEGELSAQPQSLSVLPVGLKAHLKPSDRNRFVLGLAHRILFKVSVCSGFVLVDCV